MTFLLPLSLGALPRCEHNPKKEGRPLGDLPTQLTYYAQYYPKSAACKW